MSLPRLNSSMGSHFPQNVNQCELSLATPPTPSIIWCHTLPDSLPLHLTTSQAFIWHRTFTSFAYDIFSAQNTLLLFLHMIGCFSPVFPEITLSWERPSWSPWLIYSGYSVLFANSNMWNSFTNFLVYSSDFFWTLFWFIFIPFITEPVREVTISFLFISEYPVLAYNGISTSAYINKWIIESIYCFISKNFSFRGDQTGFKKLEGTKKEGDGEGNGNPLQYSCLEKSMDRSLAGWIPWDYMTEHVCMRVEGDGWVAVQW